MKKKVIAVVGCGNISNSHFPALMRTDGVEVRYACDLLPDRARNAVQKYGAKLAITDFNQAIADSEVDAVYVLTPNYSHYEITTAALKAGKHVFCEKPITVNYELSRQMKQLADDNKLMLQIGVCNRYHRSVERIKRAVENGDLGEVYHVYISFRDYRCVPGLGGDFTTKAKSGGGVLIDWGVHFLDLVQYITGAKVKTVSAECYSKLAADIPSYVFKKMWADQPKKGGINDVEEFVSGFARTDKSSISFNGAWAQNIGKREMFIDFLGDKAGIRLDYGELYTVWHTNDGALCESRPDYNIPDMYAEEDKAFIESLSSGKKNRANIDNVIESAKIMDAIYLSAEKHGEVSL